MTARNGTGTVVVPLQELLEAMSDGVLITDENGKCTYSNPALNELVGAKACDPSLGEELRDSRESRVKSRESRGRRA